MRVTFISKAKASLPEIRAYQSYLFSPEDSIFVAPTPPPHSDTDLIWWFMGFDSGRRSTFTVHDYRSLSVPPLPRLKDAVKRLFCSQPHIRIFLNSWVQQELGFRDDIPNVILDMGVDPNFLEAGTKHSVEPDYDFVYVGEISRARGMHRFLAHAARPPLNKMRFLFVGRIEPALKKAFGDVKTFTFTGYVSYTEVPSLLARARYALNIVPRLRPHMYQTSTKLLEYLAVGLKTISTRTDYVEQFLAENPEASVFIIKDNFSNLVPSELGSFSFKSPDMRKYTWPCVIERSGIRNVLAELFENKREKRK